MIDRIRIYSALVAGGLLLAGASVQAQGRRRQSARPDRRRFGAGRYDSDGSGLRVLPHAARCRHHRTRAALEQGAGRWRRAFHALLDAQHAVVRLRRSTGGLGLAGLPELPRRYAGDGRGTEQPWFGRLDPGRCSYRRHYRPMTGTPVPVLGEDLSNDHPISMQYWRRSGRSRDTPADGTFRVAGHDWAIRTLCRPKRRRSMVRRSGGSTAWGWHGRARKD